MHEDARPMSSKERARRATRDALLRAASEMLFEAPGADPIGALKPVEVARRADPPRSNGAFYNIWPTQADFRRELLQHVLAVDRIEVGEPTTSTMAALLGDSAVSTAEAFRIVANLNFDGLKYDSAFRLRYALWSRHRTDPEVRELLAALYDDVSTMMVPMYEAFLAKSGRVVQDPYTVETVAVTLTALVEGLQLRWSVQPEAVADEAGRPMVVDPNDAAAEGRWNLFASVAYTTFLAMTRPASSAPTNDELP